MSQGWAVLRAREGELTPEQLERLRANGCTEGQGFLFSRPRPAADLAEILARRGHFAERAA